MGVVFMKKTLHCRTTTVSSLYLQNSTCGYLLIHSLIFPFTGNIRLPFLFERNPREVWDRHKLPSPSLALPSDWRAAQPSNTERGGTQPLRGPFCSGSYGRLIDDIPPLCGNTFSFDAHPHRFFPPLFLLWLNGHYAQGIIEIKS